MVNEIKYTSVRRILDDLLEDAHMESLTLEQVVRHTVRFIQKHGYPKFYQDKVVQLEIHDFRALLPCDLVSINQVKDCNTGICMRSMTDEFPEGLKPYNADSKDIRPQHPFRHYPENTWKTQGTVLYTSFPEGIVELSYKFTPVDDDGFPMLIDNESYLDALEAYISMKVIRNKFRQGKIAAAVYQDAQQEYAFAAAILQSEMCTPSMSEFESISRMWNTLIPRVRQFDLGFKHLGDREYIKKH